MSECDINPQHAACALSACNCVLCVTARSFITAGGQKVLDEGRTILVMKVVCGEHETTYITCSGRGPLLEPTGNAASLSLADQWEFRSMADTDAKAHEFFCLQASDVPGEEGEEAGAAKILLSRRTKNLKNMKERYDSLKDVNICSEHARIFQLGKLAFNDPQLPCNLMCTECLGYDEYEARIDDAVKKAMEEAAEGKPDAPPMAMLGNEHALRSNFLASLVPPEILGASTSFFSLKPPDKSWKSSGNHLQRAWELLDCLERFRDGPTDAVANTAATMLKKFSEQETHRAKTGKKDPLTSVTPYLRYWFVENLAADGRLALFQALGPISANDNA